MMYRTFETLQRECMQNGSRAPPNPPNTLRLLKTILTYNNDCMRDLTSLGQMRGLDNTFMIIIPMRNSLLNIIIAKNVDWIQLCSYRDVTRNWLKLKVSNIANCDSRSTVNCDAGQISRRFMQLTVKCKAYANKNKIQQIVRNNRDNE